MDADEIRRALRVLRKAGDRQSGGVGSEDSALRQHGFHGFDDGLLHVAVFKDGLDDEIGIGERLVIRRRGDEVEQSLALLLRQPALSDGRLDAFFAMTLALVGGFLIAIHQRDGDAGGSRDISDGSAHEARTNDANLLELGLRLAGRAARALAQFLHGNEQRADHAEGFLRAKDFGEITLLHLQRRVEGQLQAFIDAFENGECCRIVAGAFTAQNGRCCGPELGSGRRPDATAGSLEALFIPGRDWFQAVLDHLLSSGDQLIRLHHLMHQTHSLGARAGQRLAGRHHLQCRLRIRQTRHTLGAAGAGENADLDFGQGDLEVLGAGGDPAVAGKREFKRAAHAGAVDGRDPGLAIGLDLAEQARHAANQLEQLCRRLIGVLRLLIIIEGEHRLDHRKIGAAGKGAFA